MASPANEYACVVLLVNHYVATHVQGNKKKFISPHPEKDIKVAQAAARSFAENNHISCQEGLLTISPPLITVIKVGEKWFPAELHSDKIQILKKFSSVELGGSQEEATNMAGRIALVNKTDSIPSIGISLAK